MGFSPCGPLCKLALFRRIRLSDGRLSSPVGLPLPEHWGIGFVFPTPFFSRIGRNPCTTKHLSLIHAGPNWVCFARLRLRRSFKCEV